MSEGIEELRTFIEEWQDDPENIKKGFLYLKDALESLDDVIISFVPREGVTYSLRGQHSEQKDRPLFVMVDVIEGDPRWLSVCFYGEMVTDPEENGDFVPQGLLGEDAVCFDMDSYSDEHIHYLRQRIEEAYSNAV